MDLVFDTETTSVLPERARIVQFAAILIAPDADEPCETINMIVNPGVPIPPETTAIHGIDNQRAEREGMPPAYAITMFASLLIHATRIIAHNIAYDRTVVRCEATRHGILLPTIKRSMLVCTQATACDAVNLPPTERMIAAGRHHPKSPKLEEAYRALVDANGFADAHNAFADLVACHRVLRACEARGLPLLGGSKY